MKKRVLVVAPHPDDETLGVGGTIAKFINEVIMKIGNIDTVISYNQLVGDIPESIGNIYGLDILRLKHTQLT